MGAVEYNVVEEHPNTMLLSEEDWSSIQETLYLFSIPGMRESIKEGLSTSAAECAEELDW